MRLMFFSLCFLYSFCYSVVLDIPNKFKPYTSVLIKQVNKNIIYKLNEDEPRLIASNVKLFTTYFALNELHPDFHWYTKLLYSGFIKNYVLYGNLYLVGGGDPTLSTSSIYYIFSKLKNLGIKKIVGQIILDSSLFNSIPRYSFLDTNPYDTDTILPTGLMINGENVNVKLTVEDKVVKLDSDLYRFSIVNNLKIDKKELTCAASLYDKIKVDKISDKIILSGSISSSCKNKKLAYRFLSNFAYNRMIVHQIIDHFCIDLDGDVVGGLLDKRAKLIFEYQSPNLEQVLMDMNKFSKNLIAETIILTVGAIKTTNNNTYQQGITSYKEFLKKNGFLNKASKMENGAGLSRFEYFSASEVVGLLEKVSNSKYKSEFIATLPIPGMDGTLKNSFMAYQDNVHAKTGRLNDTYALSGYFVSRSGVSYVFSVIFNNTDDFNSDLYAQSNSIITSLFKQLYNR